MVSDEMLYKVAKLIVLGLVVHVFVLGYVFMTGYQGRVDLVKSQRAGCDRAKLDRSANASGWRNAEHARRDAGEFDVANEYARIAAQLELRSRTDCEVAFPKASFLP